MKSLLRRSVNRVTVPEGEILSFAQPLESIQRKGGSTAASWAPRFCWGSVERTFCTPTDSRHLCRAPVVANPKKTCGARRGKREKTTLLRNVSYSMK